MELKLSNIDKLYFAEQITSYNQGKLDRLFYCFSNYYWCFSSN